MDKGKVMDVFFLDEGKVFDTGPHSTLQEEIFKPWDEQVNNPLSEELAGGQSLKGCNEWSYIWQATAGIPQGIYLQYIDLDAGAECSISKFADDTRMEDAV